MHSLTGNWVQWSSVLVCFAYLMLIAQILNSIGIYSTHTHACVCLFNYVCVCAVSCCIWNAVKWNDDNVAGIVRGFCGQTTPTKQIRFMKLLSKRRQPNPLNKYVGKKHNLIRIVVAVGFWLVGRNPQERTWLHAWFMLMMRAGRMFECGLQLACCWATWQLATMLPRQLAKQYLCVGGLWLRWRHEVNVSDMNEFYDKCEQCTYCSMSVCVRVCMCSCVGF